MADQVIVSINIEYLDAEWAPEEGGVGYYYEIKGTGFYTGPFETEELAIAAVETYLNQCAAEFVKQSLHLE
jgi:hypothetical protein